ncbi:thymidylate kinase isoform X1 [Chelonia mydas]|uniref:thymidylate kinase isoform X1 n=1 Tax=Chelonia mydas TaxID=8469 RepID=UPI0018A1F4D9|nr:thymidylate kinase isoform X1 [Chelonia mydas]XP_037764000.1 thymidylate kinase isoform X1 [Chelonia mydas]XP_043378392.1 thymidylate kinase isoform X1 [Chelonia mydas]
MLPLLVPVSPGLVTVVARAASAMACRRGALVVLEGVDRTGKTTQSRRLVEALRESGHLAELLRFPDRTTEIGRLISSYLENKSNLEDHTVHLLFSANRWEQVPLIKEKLNQGITLVVDRYAFSGVAFTSAKENFSLDWCKQPDVGLPKPDLILFLQLSTLEAAKRGDFGNERYENSSFQEKVLQNYYHLIKDKTLNWKKEEWGPREKKKTPALCQSYKRECSRTKEGSYYKAPVFHLRGLLELTRTVPGKGLGPD